MTTYQPKIEIPTGSFAPDSWNDSLSRLPADFVVSRNRDGKPASHRGDLFWDWTSYHPSHKSTMIYFSYWVPNTRSKSSVTVIPPERAQYVADIQHLLTLPIWKDPRPEKWAAATIQTCAGILCDLARYAEYNKMQIPDVLGDPKKLIKFCSTIPESRTPQWSSIFSILLSLDPVHIGFEFAGNAAVIELRKRSLAYVGKNKQTPPIPTRIYSALLNNLKSEIDDFELVADRYFDLLRALITLMNTPGYDGTNRDRGVGCKLIDDSGLKSFIDAKKIERSIASVFGYLTSMQMTCKHTVQAYSGMRHKECMGLPYDCKETEMDGGHIHHIICGITTKLNKGKIRRTKWVTSSEGHRAIDVARRIALFIYECVGDIPTKRKGLHSRYRLFVANTYAIQNRTLPTDDGTYAVATMCNWTIKKQSSLFALRNRLVPIITEADLLELELIDPHRDWRSEDEFRIGGYWKLESHQWRRSLALYAQRSGFVSLPSLRRQLQHLTQEMSLYYSNGSAFAKNFIEDDEETYKKHFCKEWRDTKPESEALTLLRDVFDTEEQLFGGAGTFFQRKKDRGEITDRDTIIRQAKKGLIAYRAHALGGCIKVGGCDQIGLRALDAECVKDGCENLILKMSKLGEVIPAQQKLVDSLDPSTVEYRMEKSDLDVLVIEQQRLLNIDIQRTNAKST